MPTPMKCWICGATANSGEHKIKKSDLKSVAGSPTQSDPLYMHNAERKNRRIGSLKANALKYRASLCQDCNSRRTQPHDLAWEHLSSALRSRKPPIKAGQFIRANKIFSNDPPGSRRAMRNVHLYIVKMFGCMIVEGNVNIDIRPFANAILEDRVHPNIYAAFGPAPKGKDEEKVIAGISDLELAMLDKQCAFALFIYYAGKLWVRVMYAIDGEKRQGLKGAWNPKFGSKRLEMVKFD